MSRWLKVLVFVGFALCLTGCPSGDKSAGGTSTKAPQKDAAAVEAPPKPVFVPTIDAKLDGLLDRMVKECKFTSAGASPRGCDALDKEADQHIRDQGIATLDTLTEALHKGERAKASAAGWLLLANYPSTVLANVSKSHAEVSEASAMRLLDAVRKHQTKKNGAHSYAELAVNLASIKGLNDEARALIDELRDDNVKAAAIKGLMRYGRMANFEAVKEYAKSDNNKIRNAALGAPSTMVMWSQADKAHICPWMHGFIGEPNTQIVANAMLTCGGEYIDKFLDEADRRVAIGSYKRPFAFATREVCSRTFFGQKKERTPEQCERTKKLLLNLVDNETASDDVRGFAAASIAYSWRDEASLKLMKTYQKHKNPKVKAAGDKQVVFLEKWLKSKTKQ